MTAEPEPAVEFDAVTKIYRTKTSFFGESGEQVVALNRLALSIQKGEIFGLVGESGSGKTTAGRLIVRLEKPDAGRVIFAGEDVSGLRGQRLRNFRRRVQMIFQDPYQSLNPYMSVYDTVCEPLVIHGLGRKQQRTETVVEALSAVGLTPAAEFLHRFPHELSGGQRQRVAIARATVLGPDFIVADEPTSMLDASISVQIFNILVRLRERLGATFLFITHSLAAALYLCDRIAVIRHGEILERGAAETIIRNPTHPYTRELIRAQPRLKRSMD